MKEIEYTVGQGACRGCHPVPVGWSLDNEKDVEGVVVSICRRYTSPGVASRITLHDGDRCVRLRVRVEMVPVFHVLPLDEGGKA